MKAIQAIILFLITALLLSSCGNQSSGLYGASFGNSISSKKSAQKSSSTSLEYSTNSIAPNQQTDPSFGATNLTVSAQCQSLTNKINQLAQSCSPTLYENSDVVPSSCLKAFGGLNTADCSNGSSRINAAINACNSVFQQYASYLPSSCRSAIQSLGG